MKIIKKNTVEISDENGIIVSLLDLSTFNVDLGEDRKIGQLYNGFIV
ncbi:MAG: hypothetical protein P1P85_04730 [Patescibacteria group bacterium]|nr:hypothetical protein [Patescibacteria group bacterium]